MEKVLDIVKFLVEKIGFIRICISIAIGSLIIILYPEFQQNIYQVIFVFSFTYIFVFSTERYLIVNWRYNKFIDNITKEQAILILYFFNQGVNKFDYSKELNYNNYEKYITTAQYFESEGLMKIIKTKYAYNVTLSMNMNFYNVLKNKKNLKKDCNILQIRYKNKHKRTVLLCYEIILRIRGRNGQPSPIDRRCGNVNPPNSFVFVKAIYF